MSDVKSPGRVRRDIEGRVLRITIDNAAKRNAFSPEMMRQLSDALTELDHSNALWAGVICAEGEHFTAGLDLPKFFGPEATAQPLPPDNVDPLGLTKRCRKPVITAVQGYTYTLGIEMLLAGDIAIAADTARFSQLEAKRGIAPFGGAHFRFLQRMGWGDAMYHLMLCDEFDAARALKIGLVQEVVSFGRQIERAMEIAELITRNAPLGVQVTKEASLLYLRDGERAAIDFIPTMKERVLGSEDAREGILSFKERRAGVFQGR